MFDTICKLPDTESNKALLQELNTDWGEYKLAGFLCQDMVGLDCTQPEKSQGVRATGGVGGRPGGRGGGGGK